MLNTAQRIDILEAYNFVGASKFYRLLLSNGIKQLVEYEEGMIKPELQYLDIADRLLTSFRQEKQSIYLELSKLFRQAAHKIYRIANQVGISPANKRFLQLVV